MGSEVLSRKGSGLGPSATGVTAQPEVNPNRTLCCSQPRGKVRISRASERPDGSSPLRDRFDDVRGQRSQLQDAHHIGVVHVEGLRQIRDRADRPALNRVRPGKSPAQGLNQGRLHSRQTVRNLPHPAPGGRKSSSGPAFRRMCIGMWIRRLPVSVSVRVGCAVIGPGSIPSLHWPSRSTR